MNVEEYTRFVQADMVCDEARMVLEDYLALSKIPRGTLAAVQREAKTSGWYKTSWGLVEMAAANKDFSAPMLHAFADRIEVPATIDDATLQRASYLLKLIHETQLVSAADSDAVQELLHAAGDDSERTWNDLTLINPFSETFLNMTSDAERLNHIIAALA